MTSRIMEQFLQPNNADEVRTGLFNMRLIKALGIDGMHALSLIHI